MRLSPCLRAGVLAGALAAALACQQASPPVVKQRTLSAAPGSLDVVAVLPFSPRQDLAQNLLLEGIQQDPEEIAALVTTFFYEALVAQDVRAIPPSDVENAFANQGRATPRRDPRAAAELCAREFGATSVVLGEVHRWRDLEGEAYGADRPASVGYQVNLFEVEGSRRLWSSRFDHTQRTLTADPLMARKYPGGGTRFLSAAELARWGARDAAASLVEGQWRPSR